MERKVQSFDSDFSMLKPEQLDTLRGKLKEFALGSATEKAATTPTISKEPACCHSSHFDNDGWF